MNSILKRSIALLLAAAAVFSFAACGALDFGGITEPDSTDEYSILPTPYLTEEPTQEAPADTTAKPTDAPTAVPTDKPTDGPIVAVTKVPQTQCPVSEDGVYDSKDEVALYIHLFGHLPSNYITKDQAQGLGWPGGYLEPYAPGKCIGGDYFGNYEYKLPTARGRKYYECDIGTLGKRSRGAKRIIFSNDGLIYYTDDHYETFTLLYGEE